MALEHLETIQETNPGELLAWSLAFGRLTSGQQTHVESIVAGCGAPAHVMDDVKDAYATLKGGHPTIDHCLLNWIRHND